MVTGQLSIYDVLPPGDDPPLSVLRAQLLEERDRPGGTQCPTCTRHVQLYRRKLNSGMARSLIDMWRVGRRRWIHLPTEIGARSREEGKLRWWDLVEEADEERDDGGRAGWWRITAAGEAFVLRQLRVPSHAVVYLNTVERLEGDPVSITEALGRRFDYRELMEGTG